MNPTTMPKPMTLPRAPAPAAPSLNIMPQAAPTPQAVMSGLPAPQLPPAQPQMREFGDAKTTRQFIYEDALAAAQGIEPIEDDNYSLRLTNVGWHDPERYKKKDRKHAVLTGETLSRRMKGTWELHDKRTGALVEKQNKIVGAVPYLSSMGTFTHRGNEYTVNHQQRLKGGVFARVKDNGEIESHFNILPGKGVSHRYFLDPEKGQFKIKFGQSEMPLMPLLQAMGATDREIQTAWGPELWQANLAKNDAIVLRKLSQRLLRRKDLDGSTPGSATQKLVERFNSMELDPSVTRRTLGQPFDRVSKEAILAATGKLLRVSKKEEDPDDRDHLAYQQFLGPEDLFSERLRRDHNGVRKAIFREIAKEGSLKRMKSGALTGQLEQVLVGSGLAQALEEINPAEVFDKQSRITRLGEGGIPSVDSIPDEARSVQPSHMGFMDPIRTPESFRVGVDLQMARASRKGRDGQIYTMVRGKDGKEVYKSPEDLSEATIATPEVLSPKSMWAGMKRVPVMKAGKIDYVGRDEIDYTLPDFNKAFSPLSNLVPFMSATKPGRVSMGARYMTQALPVKDAESPWVQNLISGDAEGRSYEDDYGKHMGALRAEQGGRVMKLDEDGTIHVKYEDGTTDEIDTYQNHPFNRKSVTGDTEIFVKRGTKVWPTRIDAYEWQDDDLTLSVDPVTKKSSWMRVTGYTKHRNDKKLLRVKTRSGREVVVTEDHSLITIDDAGEMAPVYPKDCVVGKTRLPVAMLPEPPLGERVCKPDGVIDGLYLAEGHCPPAQPGLVCIAVQDEERAEQVVRFLKGCGLNAYRNGGNVCFTDHDMCSRLVKFFGHLSHNKVIPAWVFSSTYDYRWGLIQGYMSGDGCLWADSNGAVQLTAVSVSKKLRDGLVDVLSSLGVFTTLFDADRSHLNDQWRDGYGFRVLSRQICNLPRWFFYTDREAKLRKLLKKVYRSSEFEAVPVTKAGRKTLYAEFAVVPKYVHKTALAGAVAKHRLLSCTGNYGKWAASNVMWDAIVSIEEVPHERYVYDLSVAKSEAFAVCHGLIVHNTYIHQTPVVKVGDTFQKGGLLARSNYTDDKGATALGLNMRVAYFPYKGLNFEDAQVISESAAKRLSSEHMYQHDVEVSDKHKMGLKAYVGLFPGKFDRKTLETLDDQGVIKVGQTVEYGKPLILAAKERDRAQNKIHKKRQPGYSDDSVLWKHHDTGTVTDVVWGKNGPVVLVKSTNAMQVGDKMSGRYGDKGVVSAIIPDDQMPHDKDGKPFEVLLSPDGIITRTNPSQEIEAALGKLAQHTGKPVKVPDFEDIEDLQDWADKQLKQAGLSSTEDVIWPEKGTRVPGIGTGYRFMMKLHHTAESKGQGRDSGSYSTDETPAKGGESGCFTGDTLVRTWPSRAKAPRARPIGELVAEKYDGMVASGLLPHDHRPQTSYGWEKVTDWFEYHVPATDLITLTLANGQEISVTKNHVFFLKDGSKKFAGDLREGDDLLEGCGTCTDSTSWQ